MAELSSASHNPKQWNALKLLNDKGEFISGENGAEVLTLAKMKISIMRRLMI
jgi:phosphomannomutase